MVNDLDPAVKFYTTYQGFRVKQESKPNFAILDRGSLELVGDEHGGHPVGDGVASRGSSGGGEVGYGSVSPRSAGFVRHWPRSRPSTTADPLTQAPQARRRAAVTAVAMTAPPGAAVGLRSAGEVGKSSGALLW